MLSFLFSHFSCPRGRLGRWIAKSMNRSHRPLTQYVLDAIALKKQKNVLDIGCGGGATIAELCRRLPQARICGIDHSATAVDVARQFNADAIRAGHCEILVGNVSDLPYRDDAFDLITAIETIYFWPDPLQSFHEVARVLRPGGYFLIGTDTGSPRLNRYVSKLMPEANLYKPAEVFYFAESAGFHIIACETDPNSPIAIRIILQKPIPPTK